MSPKCGAKRVPKGANQGAEARTEKFGSRSRKGAMRGALGAGCGGRKCEGVRRDEKPNL